MKRLLLLLLLVVSCTAFAQHTDSVAKRNRVFQLGEVVVTGTTTDSVNTISYKKIEKFNRTDIANTLNVLPGITLANVGARNEAVVYVRGFDVRQVPVYIDGVPVYVPYDGYVDMSRFTTFDLSSISVSKGFSSMLYGPNTMGGAINLVSRKPLEKLEMNGRIGVFSGEGLRWNVNSGSNFGKFYTQVCVSKLKQNFYPLPADYKQRRYQRSDERENSYRDDLKLSAKFGFTPNDTDEYVIGYVNQQGEKGTPPYVGDDPAIRTRFWQWPKWNKQSLFLVGNTNLGDDTKLKSRFYYDTFVNELFSYDDTTYTTISRPYAFKSYYDDYTLGASSEFESRELANNVIKIGIQVKRDVHREHNKGEPERRFTDNTVSVMFEDILQVTPTFSLVPGMSYNARHTIQAEDFNSSTQEISSFDKAANDAVNAQLGLFWDFKLNHSLKATIAKKTRFATIKDRFSYRMGQAIPNPELSAETAWSYDLTYTGKFFNKVTTTFSAYRSEISDIIQQVDNVQPGRFQLQNAGKALFYGSEANVDYLISKNFNVGANYSYIRRKNETKPTILFTNVPNHKTFAFAEYSFLKKGNVLVSAEYNSKRYSTSYGTETKGFTLWNTKASYQIVKYLGVEGGVNNIMDKNYMLVEGFPEAGRNYFVNIVYQL